jgi:hypothetical protein
MTSTEDSHSATRLIPLTRWPSHHEWPTIAGLRHLVFTMPKGFDRVVKRVGSRILLDEAAWFKWVDEQNEGGCHGA